MWAGVSTAAAPVPAAGAPPSGMVANEKPPRASPAEPLRLRWLRRSSFFSLRIWTCVSLRPRRASSLPTPALKSLARCRGRERPIQELQQEQAEIPRGASQQQKKAEEKGA